MNEIDNRLPQISPDQIARLARWRGDADLLPLNEMRSRNNLKVARIIALAAGTTVLAVTLPQLVRDLLR